MTQIKQIEQIEAQKWMQLAIQSVQENTIRTSPNPKVGCVIVNDQQQVIAKGVSDRAGGAHAEINALRMAGHQAKGAKLYVTLEPCSHYGRTPPCVLSIIEAGIQEVWIGTMDPNPLVAGKGIQILRDHGIRVEVGIEEEACNRLHQAFKKWITQKRPWVSLKVASSLDGSLATTNGDSKWITGIESRTKAHALRAKADAILIGGHTAREDRPQLNVRLSAGEDPRVVILSKHLDLPLDLPCLKQGTILAHAPDVDQNHKKHFLALGCECIELPYLLDPSDQKTDLLNLPSLLDALGQREICHLLVEGGGKLHGQFVQSGLADDLYLFFSPRLIGQGRASFDFPSVTSIQQSKNLKKITLEELGNDLLLHLAFVI
jgi:diaminohydroxyphosphoribosylaminopyrimidine deaminase/5-amino-6-(5-phosphoribosylamino)uracil reductase